MCDETSNAVRSGRGGRRTFLRTAGAAAAMGALMGGPLAGVSYAEALTKAQRDRMTPDDVIALMKKGNARFRSGRRDTHNFLAQQRASAKA